MATRLTAIVLGAACLWPAATTAAVALGHSLAPSTEGKGVKSVSGEAPAEPAVGTVFADCPNSCPEVVVLPAGAFRRGAPLVHGDPPPPYTPPETVVIERPLAVGRYDVTVGQYAAFVRATRPKNMGNCQTDRGTVGPYRLDPQGSWSDPGFEQSERHPVVCITVADAKAYAAWLSKKTGQIYRLPTQKEWEYAARAGEVEDRMILAPPGEPLCPYANLRDTRFGAKYPDSPSARCDDGHVNTSPVGTYPPNGFGLYDMVGNVAQWTDTVYPGPTLVNVAAGGSWNRPLEYEPLSAQSAYDSNMRRPWIGFRVVRELQ